MILRIIARRLGMVTAAQHNAEIGDLTDCFNQELRAYWLELERVREEKKLWEQAAQEYAQAAAAALAELEQMKSMRGHI